MVGISNQVVARNFQRKLPADCVSRSTHQSVFTVPPTRCVNRLALKAYPTLNGGQGQKGPLETNFSCKSMCWITHFTDFISSSHGIAFVRLCSSSVWTNQVGRTQLPSNLSCHSVSLSVASNCFWLQLLHPTQSTALKALSTVTSCFHYPMRQN